MGAPAARPGRDVLDVGPNQPVNDLAGARALIDDSDQENPMTPFPRKVCLLGEVAREIIAWAEALGFVREPTLGGVDGYEAYLIEDALEALEWLRREGVTP